MFAKETSESTQKEVKDIGTQIKGLNDTEVNHCDGRIKIN